MQSLSSTPTQQQCNPGQSTLISQNSEGKYGASNISNQDEIKRCHTLACTWPFLSLVGADCRILQYLFQSPNSSSKGCLWTWNQDQHLWHRYSISCSDNKVQWTYCNASLAISPTNLWAAIDTSLVLHSQINVTVSESIEQTFPATSWEFFTHAWFHRETCMNRKKSKILTEQLP